MTIQELVDYYDSHPELQEEIIANTLEWWKKEINSVLLNDNINNKH